MLLASFTPDVTKVSVYIQCGFSKTRIRFPVRGAKCEHLQCFDLHNYIQSNVHYRKWQCPVCGKSTLTLRYCPLTHLVLNKTRDLHPHDKYKNKTQNDLVELFLTELANHKAGLPDEDEQNDIWRVYIEK